MGRRGNNGKDMCKWVILFTWRPVCAVHPTMLKVGWPLQAVLNGYWFQISSLSISLTQSSQIQAHLYKVSSQVLKSFSSNTGTTQARCAASQGVSPAQGYAPARKKTWLSSSSASVPHHFPCSSERYFWHPFTYLEYLWYLHLALSWRRLEWCSCEAFGAVRQVRWRDSHKGISIKYPDWVDMWGVAWGGGCTWKSW